MKQEDKEIKQKIEALNTLSGGIVFGKEEAWDKLQTRLNKKPVKKIPVIYWLAAAVLLLMCGILALYNQPAKEVAKKELIIREEIKTAPPIQEPAPTQVENVILQNIQPQIKEKHKRAMTDVPAEVTDVQQVQSILTALEKQTTDITVVTGVTPPLAVKKPMKVVSIYDLENKNNQQNVATSLIDNTSPGVDLNKIRVVHINEVEREVNEFIRIRKESGFAQHYPLFRHPTDEDYQNRHEYHPQYNLLKNMFNPQN